MSFPITPESLIKTIKGVFPSLQQLPLHEPRFSGNEWAYVKECLDTGWVSSVGKFVDLFERHLTDYTGSPHAVACVNGTAALEICVRLAGTQAGDEVIVPALTFAATANAIAHCGGIPHFVDCERTSLGVDAEKLRQYLSETAQVLDGTCFNRTTGRKIKTLVIVHVFGHPADIDAISAVCNEFKIHVVEDAAEALGSFYKGRHAGSTSELAALSFNGNKILTTGGGGAILVRNPELAKLAKHLTTTAKRPHAWEFFHDQVGYNYRLPNINAALGCAQLEQLPRFLEIKRRLHETYASVFQNSSGVSLLAEPTYARSNYWLNALVLAPSLADQREVFLKSMNEAGVMTRPIWTLLHRLPMYQSCPRSDLSVSENLEKRVLNIPSGVGLGEALL